MAKVQHPVWVKDVRTVKDADLAEWVKAGWVDLTPKPEPLPEGEIIKFNPIPRKPRTKK